MSTKISWADETWNPIVGCTKVSAGCANCYAEKMAYRISCNRRIERTAVGKAYGNVVNGAGEASWRRQWSGRTSFIESALTKPLHWRTPRKIFVVSMGDLFHESVPKDWLHKIFTVMESVPRHQFMLLTKRSKQMMEYVSWRWGQKHYKATPGHIHLGVTVENPDNIWRIEDLIQTAAAKRFVSFEPLLCGFDVDLKGIDYIFVGCESGPNARLCKSHAIRHMIRQAHNADVQAHVKQIPLKGKCNKNINEWPQAFRIREV